MLASRDDIFDAVGHGLRGGEKIVDRDIRTLGSSSRTTTGTRASS